MKTLRLLDANVNRLKEGLRVVEDCTRYILDSKKLSLRLKLLRHKVVLDSKVLYARDSTHDVLKQNIESEGARLDLSSILKANFKRAEESARVLEEFLKIEELKELGRWEDYKDIRYELYDLEKDVLAELEHKHLSQHRT
ncbi:thiamine-phosphate pyrophosphorylase [Helicobacter sp. 11S02629-2]|uniref:thiamine-phosphate pyrophosphorylase n=1 Tax=Helicobacter sp. 11S02629-2 TaxID=1476195 RepID=UPI000BA6297C|nr:thiamine-phosphate pyrophosphorylase [Helicobacter sp. 11S02629-2]PAF45989.1 thiamine-phosphate pyrophosphorylase [Helicobacter sp. 11S02629-2]